MFSDEFWAFTFAQKVSNIWSEFIIEKIVSKTLYPSPRTQRIGLTSRVAVCQNKKMS